jgi:ATP:corrinoid adenosyltransferase
MKTPKEKAVELVKKYILELFFVDSHKYAIKAALITVDEIIASRPSKPSEYSNTIGYWQQVKEELNKL